MCERSFVIEDDIKLLAHAVLDHRLIFKNSAARATSIDTLVDIEMERLSKLDIING